MPTPTVRPAYQEPEAVTNARRARETLKAGVTVVSAPQLFPTPPDLAARVIETRRDRGRYDRAQSRPQAREPLSAPSSRRSIPKLSDTKSTANFAASCESVPSLSTQHRVRGLSNRHRGMGQFPRIVIDPPFGNAPGTLPTSATLRSS